LLVKLHHMLEGGDTWQSLSGNQHYMYLLLLLGQVTLQIVLVCVDCLQSKYLSSNGCCMHRVVCNASVPASSAETHIAAAAAATVAVAAAAVLLLPVVWPYHADMANAMSCLEPAHQLQPNATNTLLLLLILQV
jgi:hypothetical protein